MFKQFKKEDCMNPLALNNIKGGKRVTALAMDEACRILVSNRNARLVGISPDNKICVEW